MPGLMMPQRRRGLFGSAIPQSPMATEAVQPAAQPQKPKFFGEGGAGRNIAGYVGDHLLQMANMDPIYQPQMQQQQQMRYIEQRDAAKRQLDMADFRTRQEIEAEYAKPPQPHRWERNDGSLMELGPDGKPRVAYEDPTPKMMFLPDGAGGGRWVEQPRPNQSLGATPDTLPADFDGFDDDDTAPAIGAAPSRPNTVARSAYQAWVNEMGQAEADALLKRNGLRVGNY